MRQPLLILRIFLGFTFSYASLEKLANPNFFKASALGSFTEQLRGSVITSPLHHLLSPALYAPTLIALFIAFAELAVGLGTLLGLFGRIAALGGMALSLTFFLNVSFHDRPYYYGPDIVFLFAWIPLAISGSGRRPHAGCQVLFDQQVHLFVCPCQGSKFNGTTGVAVLGPAATGLTSINIKLESNGDAIVEN